MYCVNCGTPLAPGLSFCNRCGTSLKERGASTNTGSITAFLSAITSLGIVGLGIMLGGSLVLRKEAGLSQELIGVFMLFTFLIVCLTETMLIRQLSRLTSANESRKSLPPMQQAPYELRPPSAVSLGEPVSSVTENTTRTLEYSRREL
jgi:zinc-ribbon domain